MKDIMIPESGAQMMDKDVIVLCCCAPPRLETGPLKQLFAAKETAEAEALICRTLEDIARRLDALQQGLFACDFSVMIRPARRINLVADQIGLTEVSVAARHVATCLLQNDGVALQATIARLERGFDMAVNDVWNLREVR